MLHKDTLGYALKYTYVNFRWILDFRLFLGVYLYFPKQTQSVTWTEELLIAEALKYDTRVEFSKKSSSAYQTALIIG